MQRKNRGWRMVGVLAAGVALSALADRASAYPNFGSSCGGCHGVSRDAGSVTGNSGTAAPAGGSGTLKSYTVMPGATLPVTFTVPSSVGSYAVALEQLGNPGLGGTASPFSADPTWTDSGTGFYYVGPKSTTGGNTFNIQVAGGALPDVYTLMFYVAGKSPNTWSESEKFYVNVIPEPTVMGMLAMGGAALLNRRRRRA